MSDDRLSFLSHLHPYNVLPEEVRKDIAERAEWVDLSKDNEVYIFGERLKGLYIIFKGKVSVTDQNGNPGFTCWNARILLANVGFCATVWPPPRRKPSKTRG